MSSAVVINKDGKAIVLSDQEMLDNLQRNMKFQYKHGSIRFLKKKRNQLIKANKTTIKVDRRICELRNSHFSHWVLKKDMRPINHKKWNQLHSMGLVGPYKNISYIESLVDDLYKTVEDENGLKHKITIQYIFNNKKR